MKILTLMGSWFSDSCTSVINSDLERHRDVGDWGGETKSRNLENLAATEPEGMTLYYHHHDYFSSEGLKIKVS